MTSSHHVRSCPCPSGCSWLTYFGLDYRLHSLDFVPSMEVNWLLERRNYRIKLKLSAIFCDNGNWFRCSPEFCAFIFICMPSCDCCCACDCGACWAFGGWACLWRIVCCVKLIVCVCETEYESLVASESGWWKSKNLIWVYTHTIYRTVNWQTFTYFADYRWDLVAVHEVVGCYSYCLHLYCIQEQRSYFVAVEVCLRVADWKRFLVERPPIHCSLNRHSNVNADQPKPRHRDKSEDKSAQLDFDRLEREQSVKCGGAGHLHGCRANWGHVDWYVAVAFVSFVMSSSIDCSTSDCNCWDRCSHSVFPHSEVVVVANCWLCVETVDYVP